MRLPLSLPLLTVPLLLAAFGCSLFFRGTDTIWFAPAIALFLIWGVTILAPGWRQGWVVPRTATIYLIGAFCLYLWLALLWSTAPFISTLFTIVFCMLPAGLFFLALAPDRQVQARLAAYTIGTGLAVLASWALIQYFFFFDAFGTRIHHPLLNPNSLGGLLNLGLLPAIAFFMAAPSRRKTILYGLAVMLFLMAITVTRSRGAMIGGAAGLIVLLPFVVLPFSRSRFIRLGQLAGLFLLSFVILYFHARLSGLAAPLQDMAKSNFGSLLDRGSLWYSTWQMFMDHFWFGTGFSTFSYWYPAYRMPQDSSDGYFAHMDPLQFAAETGVIAYILFYAILIAILVRTIRALNRAALDSDKRVEIIGPFAAMLAVVLHTHISFHLYILAIVMPLGIMLGYWYVATSVVLDDKTLLIKPDQKGRALAIAGLVLLVLMPAQWIARAAFATHYVGQSQLYLYSDNINAMQDAISKAQRIGPSSYHIPYYDEARWRVKLLSKENRLTTAEKERLVMEALHQINKAIERNKGLVSLESTKAQLLYLADGEIVPDGREQAIVLLQHVLEKNPLFMDARLGLATMYQAQGEFKRALDVLEEGLRWPRVKGQTEINFLVRIARLRLLLGDKAGHDQMINYAGQRARAYGLVKSSK